MSDATTCASGLLPSLRDGGPAMLMLFVIMGIAALVLACAVWVALRRDPWIGLRSRQPQPDPLCDVHGDIPRLDFLSAPAPPRNRPATGAAETGGRAIPSCAPAGRPARGGANV